MLWDDERALIERLREWHESPGDLRMTGPQFAEDKRCSVCEQEMPCDVAKLVEIIDRLAV